jgi:hypothetical protein
MKDEIRCHDIVTPGSWARGVGEALKPEGNLQLVWRRPQPRSIALPPTQHAFYPLLPPVLRLHQDFYSPCEVGAEAVSPFLAFRHYKL